MHSSMQPGISTLVWRSLSFFKTMHAALGGGVAAATAVIVGALVVGDSVRGSLRSLVIDRLGNVECGLFSRTYFAPEILEPLQSASRQEGSTTVPLISLPSTSIEKRAEGKLVRAGQVQAFGVTSEFWSRASKADSSSQTSGLAVDQVVINASLARELNAIVGDEVTIRLPKQASVSPDSPLGRRDNSSVGLPRQKVVAIVPDSGIGGLNLSANQAVPKNVFVPIEAVQDVLNIGQRVNAALVLADESTGSESHARGTELCQLLDARLVPQIEDYGLKINRHRRVFPDTELGEQAGDVDARVVYDYFQISSDSLVLDDRTVAELLSALHPRVVRAMTYLANSIRLSDPEQTEPVPEVPYSTVIGIDETESLEFSNYTSVQPSERRSRVCWINSWLAKQLNAQPGKMLKLHYFHPETVDGREVETSIQLSILGIVPIVEPVKQFTRGSPAIFDKMPTVFNDPNLTPRVPGVTDQESIANWDLPFTLEQGKIGPDDEDYYDNHRLTPKLFVPYSIAQSYFGARFGSSTALRIEANKVADEAELRRQVSDAMLHVKASVGLRFRPIRAQQLAAASGTTPFDGLFLALSFFVIISALLLVALLFRLGIQQRASQWGLLLAQGFTHQRVRGLLLREAAVVAGLGAVAGVLLGLVYARFMIAGLQSWWLGAISIPFLNFSYTGNSLLIGAAVGWLACLAAIYWCLWRLERKTALDLMRGRWESDSSQVNEVGKLSLSIAAICLAAVVGLLIYGMGQSGMVRAGCFFGCGMLLLSASLIGLREWLKHVSAGEHASAAGGLLRIAGLAVCRNPLRSVLTLGLLAVASFLIASMSVFHVTPSVQGYGGFDLMAESSLPILRNVGSGAVREDVLGPAHEVLKKTTIVALRGRPGDDASCNNLFKAGQPTVWAIPRAFDLQQAAMPPAQAFPWAARKSKDELPWQELAYPALGTMSSPIPVIIDQNTAAWSLKQGGSIGAITKIEFDGTEVFFKTVGLLANSVLQGKLIIGEYNFKTIFPNQSGYRAFLINTHGEDQQKVIEALESGWSDEGLDVVASRDVLDRLLAVQNTYISAFQSLGALGLLLGTIGLAVVQLRSVLERRRELALMRAVGFSGGRISQLLLVETLILLVGGMAIGVVAASIAVVPYFWEVGQQAAVFQPIFMLCIVLLVGTTAAIIAIRSAMKQTILSGLRSE